MREASLWKWLSRVPEVKHGLHMTRIENLVDEGTPDVEGCFDGVQFWCELKVADRPARPTTPIRTKSEVKQSQIDWLNARWEAGGLAWILIQVGSHHKAKRYLLAGKWASKVRDGLTEADMELMCAMPFLGSPRRPTSLMFLKRMIWR